MLQAQRPISFEGAEGRSTRLGRSSKAYPQITQIGADRRLQISSTLGKGVHRSTTQKIRQAVRVAKVEL
jgi:hypothetical protein